MYRLFKLNHATILNNIKVMNILNTNKSLINNFKKNFFKKTNYLCKKDYYSKNTIYKYFRNLRSISRCRSKRNKKGILQISQRMASRCK